MSEAFDIGSSGGAPTNIDSSTSSQLPPACAYCGPAPTVNEKDDWYLIGFGWIPSEAKVKQVEPSPTVEEIQEDILQRLQCSRCSTMIRDWPDQHSAMNVATHLQQCQHEWNIIEEETNLASIEWATCKNCHLLVQDPLGNYNDTYRDR